MDNLSDIFTAVATIVTAVASLIAAVLGYLNRKNIKSIHIDINSRLTQLLASSSEAANAKGQIEGRATAELGALAVLAKPPKTS